MKGNKVFKKGSQHGNLSSTGLHSKSYNVEPTYLGLIGKGGRRVSVTERQAPSSPGDPCYKKGGKVIRVVNGWWQKAADGQDILLNHKRK